MQFQVRVGDLQVRNMNETRMEQVNYNILVSFIPLFFYYYYCFHSFNQFRKYITYHTRNKKDLNGDRFLNDDDQCCCFQNVSYDSGNYILW